jgi:isoamylase
MDPYRKPADSHNTAVEGKGASYTYPLGPTLTAAGVNFSIFSAHATQVEIVFFDHADAQQPNRVITLDPIVDRTSHYWHIFVPGIAAGQLYGYRVDGPGNASGGNRFDCHKVLIDPYGKSVSVGRHYDRSAASHPGDNAATSMKSVVADLSILTGREIDHLSIHFARR